MEVDKSTKIPVEHESGAQSGSDIVVGEMIDAEEGISKDNNASSDLSAAVQAYVPDTKEEKQLVRKVDIMLMPMLWVMCVLCYVDRNNISNAAAAGMNTDLKLTDNNYSMLISIFFIGYIIWEIPSNLLISRLRPSLYLPALMVAWGALVAGMSQLKNYHSILICRFFLGIIECGFFPGVLYLLTCWYKKSEVGKRFCIFYTALCFSGAASGLIAGAVMTGLDGKRGMAGWRWLFLIEGIITVGVAAVAVFAIPDYPHSSRRLNEVERTLAITRILVDQQNNENRVNSMMRKDRKLLSPWECVKATFVDLRTYFFIVIYMTQNGSGTVSYFIPTVLEHMGYTGTSKQWMTVPIWAVATVFLIIFSYTADRTGDRRWHITGGMFLAFIGAIVNLAAKDYMKVRYAFLCFYMSGLYLTLPLMLNWASETMSMPPEKRAVVIATINSIGCFSSIYGSYLWPSTDAPDYTKGLATVSCFVAVGTALAAALPIIFRHLPRYPTKAERALGLENY